MLEIIDTRDAGALDDIGLHPDKPFALVRLHRSFGGRQVASLFDRYASREEARVGLVALVRNSNPAAIEATPQGRQLSLPVVNGKELIPAFIMEDLIDDKAHAL